MKPRVIIYDLEVSPMRGYFYPPYYQTNILTADRYQTLMSASWCEFEEDRVKIRHVKLDDFPARFKLDRWDDTDTTEALYRVLKEADILIAHNGLSFDNRMANTFFIKHGLDALPEYKTIDTLKAARRHFKFASNKLDEICKELGIEGKTDIRVGALWQDYMLGTPKDAKKAGRLLKAYNNQDVMALRDVYVKLRPFIKSHPNLSVYTDGRGCPTCLGKNVVYNGKHYTNAMNYRRAYCKDCKSPFRERIAEKEEQNKPDYVK